MSFDPLLSAASRFALKNEVKAGIQEGIGSAAFTFAVVISCFAVCFLAAEGAHRLMKLLNRKEEDRGCSLS